MLSYQYLSDSSFYNILLTAAMQELQHPESIPIFPGKFILESVGSICCYEANVGFPSHSPHRPLHAMWQTHHHDTNQFPIVGFLSSGYSLSLSFFPIFFPIYRSFPLPHPPIPPCFSFHFPSSIFYRVSMHNYNPEVE